MLGRPHSLRLLGRALAHRIVRDRPLRSSRLCTPSRDGAVLEHEGVFVFSVPIRGELGEWTKGW